MSRTPEEQKAFEKEIEAAARGAEIVVARFLAAAAPEKPAASTPARATPSRAFQEAFGSGIDTPKPTRASAASVDTIGNLIAATEMEDSIKRIARAGARDPLAGEQALLNELKSNPDLMAKFGARPAQNGRSQSLGNLDLNGDGNYSSREGMAIAATINAMQANRSHADIAEALDTKGFRERATAIMKDISADLDPRVHEAERPRSAPDCTQKGGFLIPRPKGCPAR